MTAGSAGSPGRLYPERPLVGVGVVVRRGRAALLVRRAKPPRRGQWSLPGGLLRLGEPVRAAARREVREETGLELGTLELLDVVDCIERDAEGRVRYHYLLVDFTAEAVGGEPRAASDALELRWFTPEELDGIELWEETRRILRLSFDRAR